MAFDFTGKRVWVTGAGRGIGREVATQFVAAGACVVGLDMAFPEATTPMPPGCSISAIRRRSTPAAQRCWRTVGWMCWSTVPGSCASAPPTP